jgi:hypothetical protein
MGLIQAHRSLFLCSVLILYRVYIFGERLCSVVTCLSVWVSYAFVSLDPFLLHAFANRSKLFGVVAGFILMRGRARDKAGNIVGKRLGIVLTKLEEGNHVQARAFTRPLFFLLHFMQPWSLKRAMKALASWSPWRETRRESKTNRRCCC